MSAEWKERITKEPIQIGILGAIGAGKTTMSERLRNLLFMHGVEENFTVNPYLASFYEDPQKWSFKSQVWFLQSKVDQLKRLDRSQSYLLDPAMEMDRLYAQTLAKIDYMDKDEFNLYSQIFDTLKEENQIKTPDLFLWIDAKPSVIRERVQKRGRFFEMKMLRDYPYYLEELSESISSYVKSQKGKNVLHVDTTYNNFADETSLNNLVERIKSSI